MTHKPMCRRGYKTSDCSRGEARRNRIRRINGEVGDPRHEAEEAMRTARIAVLALRSASATPVVGTELQR